MAKIRRYFTTDAESENTGKRKADAGKIKKQAPILNKKEENKGVITYNVTVKPKSWRHRYKRVPAPPLLSTEKINKYRRGDRLDTGGVKTKLYKQKLQKREQKIELSAKQAALNEILLTEGHGFLEADPGETTTQFTQQQIQASVDVTAASKHFELRLNDFGPYRAKYIRNGRHLLLGGKLGHVAAFDWVTKKLHCEMNVMESVHDICWLHLETMFAVAQKDWVYIYDNQGIELHCLKKLYKVTRMEFLPYHFLLAAASDEGYLSWLDVSIGEMVSHYNSKSGRISILTHNPYNAVLCVGDSKGIVSMWSPNERDPLAKMLCHKAPVTALHVDPKGLYMATSSVDRNLKIWDIRKLHGPMQIYNLRSPAGNITFSQKNLLAVAMGNVVNVYRDCCLTSAQRPYLHHRFVSPVNNMMFCPFEDVLGVGNLHGFTSLIVPGSGEPNFDALEINPYQSKSQRKESEVKSLLEKIPANLITLNPSIIAEIDVPTLKDKIDAKKKLSHLKPPKLDIQPRNKGSKRGKSVRFARNRKIMREAAQREFLREMKDVNILNKTEDTKEKKPKVPPNVLDRFLPKNKQQ